MVFQLEPKQNPVKVENNYFDGEINDDFLFQLQKCFAFLDQTDRNSYNPYELCFSIKDYDGQPVDLEIQEDANEF